MKPALIITIVLAFVVYFAPRSKTDEYSQKKGQTSSDQRPSALTAVAALTKQNQQNRPQNNKTTAQAQSPRWYESPEWVLVIVGAITAFVIGWQSWEARKAAEASREAANAALHQANHMVTSERAWLVLERIDMPHLVPLEETPHTQQRFAHCIFWIKNYGITPARVLAVWSEIRINRSIQEPPGSAPEYSRTSPIEETYVFPPSKEQPYEARLMPNGIIRRAERDAIRYGSEFLWLRGCIKYCDVLSPDISKQHETWFCYRYETRTNNPTPFWQPGPTKYNKAN
jgi:hypothetical protein